ncbi:hypothetical protein BU17DRAFT_62467 [Hysterangium stoloniferum]|nr:hypothetical protein BU17DRAFT_62467 [Hysterangium stoloniferum]
MLDSHKAWLTAICQWNSLASFLTHAPFRVELMETPQRIRMEKRASQSPFGDDSLKTNLMWLVNALCRNPRSSPPLPFPIPWILSALVTVFGDPAISSSDSVSATAPLFSYDGKLYARKAVIPGSGMTMALAGIGFPWQSTIYHSLEVCATIPRARILSRVLRCDFGQSSPGHSPKNIYGLPHGWMSDSVKTALVLKHTKTKLIQLNNSIHHVENPSDRVDIVALGNQLGNTITTGIFIRFAFLRSIPTNYPGPNHWNQADIAMKDI